jgi:hypothetical protein
MKEKSAVVNPDITKRHKTVIIVRRRKKKRFHFGYVSNGTATSRIFMRLFKAPDLSQGDENINRHDMVMAIVQNKNLNMNVCENLERKIYSSLIRRSNIRKLPQKPLAPTLHVCRGNRINKNDEIYSS